MMRRFLLGCFCLGLTWSAQGQDETKKNEKPPVKAQPKAAQKAVPRAASPLILKTGDPAPAIKVTQWLQGKEVSKLEKGQIYVVEFWKTWHSSCIVMMPHLSELHDQYKDKGVTIIGFTDRDPDNTQEMVEAFVAKRGPKLGYTFAFADNPETYGEWMARAGRNAMGIGRFPCTFVVDKENRIAYIGHPMYLDVVLPKVVAGTWDPQVDGEKLKEIETEVSGVFKAVIGQEVNGGFKAVDGQDAEEGLKALSKFEMHHPELGKIPYFVGPKINLLLMADKKDEAKNFALRALETAAHKDDSKMFGSVARSLVGPNAKKDKDLAVIALGAVEKMDKIVGENDLDGQFTAARVKFAAGEKSQAKKHALKVLDLVPEKSKNGFNANKKIYKNMLKDILEDTSSP